MDLESGEIIALGVIFGTLFLVGLSLLGRFLWRVNKLTRDQDNNTNNNAPPVDDGEVMLLPHPPRSLDTHVHTPVDAGQVAYVVVIMLFVVLMCEGCITTATLPTPLMKSYAYALK